MLRGLLKMKRGEGKCRPKFPKCLMLLAHNSIHLCVFEFYFSIFVVSCSSLSEERVTTLVISRFILLTRLSCVPVSLTRAPHYSNISFSYGESNNSFSITRQNTGGIYLDIAAFQGFKRFSFSCHTLARTSPESMDSTARS